MPISILDQMRSGEIYVPEQGGKPAEYIIERQQYAGGQDISPVMRDTGYQDAMNARNVESENQRLMNIQQQTGAQMTGLENKLGFDPERAAKFEKLSDTDKMAAQMVASGQMAPADFYKIAKKAETDKHNAALQYLSKVDPNRNPVTIKKDGKDIGMSGQSIESFLSGDAMLDIDKPYPTMVYNVGSGGNNTNPYDKRVEDARIRNTYKDFVNDKFVKAMPVVDQYYQNSKVLFDEYMNSKGSDRNAKRQALDQTIMYGFNKALDEASAVMPGEFARTYLGQSLGQSIANKFESKAFGGLELNDKQRKLFIDAMGAFKNNAVANARMAYDRANNEATVYGFDKKRVTGGYEKFFPSEKRSSFIDEDDFNQALANDEVKEGQIIVGGRPATWSK